MSIGAIIDFLVQNRLAPFHDGLVGGFTTVDRGGRNRNTWLRTAGGSGCHVKQSVESGSLYREIGFYEYALTTPVPARFLPRLIHIDRERSLLVLENLTDAIAFRERFPIDGMDRVLGQALGTIHASHWNPADDWPKSLPSEPPRIFGLHRPDPGLLTTLSPATRQLIRVLQTEPGLGERLTQSADLWEPDTLIHGDLKSDNILVLPPQRDGTSRIRIIDWETTQRGDAAWDVAGVLQDMARFWVRSMRVVTEGLEAMLASARHPWQLVQAAMAEFWSGYLSAAACRPADVECLLNKAVHFSAVRMIQSAYEAADPHAVLPVESVLLLQLAANVLADPEAARDSFYRLSPFPSTR